MSEAALNGLETLQMLMREKRNPAIGDTLDFTLVEVEKGRAVFEGTPSEKVYNPIGSVHGGYAAALLDSACGSQQPAVIVKKRAATLSPRPSKEW